MRANRLARQRALSAYTKFSVHVSADLCVAFGRTSSFLGSRDDFDFDVAEHDGVDFVHQVIKRVDVGTARPERADCNRLLHRYPLCLVELSSRPTESDFARAHARRVSQLAPRPGNLSRRPGRARGRDQSISVARDFLFCLSPLLDGRDLAGHRPGHFAFPLANSISRMAQTLNDARDWQRGMLRYEQGGIAQRPDAVIPGKINRFSV